MASMMDIPNVYGSVRRSFKEKRQANRISLLRRRRTVEQLEGRDLFDATYFPLANSDFSQDWTDTSLIQNLNDWSGVPSIIGYRGDDATPGTSTDPQTILQDLSLSPQEIRPSQGNPNTLTFGGIGEFDQLDDPVVAMQGSGTADAPHLVLHLDTTGRSLVNVSYLLRDIDGSADNAQQQFALQYRVGTSGDFVNVPAGYVADASSGPGQATLETAVSVTLPSAVNDQPNVQVRILTTNAGGADEWVGIDDILVTSVPFVAGSDFSISTNPGSEAQFEGNSGSVPYTYTVTRDGDAASAVTLDWNLVAHPLFPNAVVNDFTGPTSGIVEFGIGEVTKTITVLVNGDSVIEPDEGFGIQLSNPPLGSSIINPTALSVIVNDEFQTLVPGDVVITSIQTLPNPDNFGFVPLVDIAPFMTLRFTDNGWDGQVATPGLNNAEGTVNYVAPAEGLTRGTKVVLTQFGDVLTGPGTAYATPSRTVSPGAFAFAGTGDSLFVFTGTEFAPETIQMLFGLTTNESFIESYPVEAPMNNTLSFLPPMLVLGQSAILPLGGLATIGTTVEEARYNHSLTVGTYEELRNAVADRNNWTGDSDGSITEPPNTINFTLVENVPGVIVNQSNGTTEVVEGGAGDSYAVSLVTAPSEPVQITITPDAQLDLGAGAGVAVVLNFTTENALTPQTVNVMAVNDTVDEGPHTGTISSVATSVDVAYNNLTVADMVVSIQDNDTVAFELYLNEILIDLPGTDSGSEYLEFRGAPGAVIPNDVYLVLLEGDGGGGVIDHVFTLGGMTLGANGFLTLLQAGSTYTVDPNSSVVTATGTGWGTVFSSRDNDIENGSTSFLLIQSAMPPTPSADVDGADNGVLTGEALDWTILDSIGILDGDATDTAYGAINFSATGVGVATGTIFDLTTFDALVGDGFTPDYLGRNGNTTGQTVSDWVAADITGSAPIWSLDPAESYPAALTGDLNHLGATNVFTLQPSLVVSIAPESFSENGGTATGTVVRTGPTTGDLVVSLVSSDQTEATVPATVTILDGQASATFVVTGVDDAMVDGVQLVTITAAATGFDNVTADVNVTDDDVVRPTLLITEIMYNPQATEDNWEWVEVYNFGASTIDLAGFVIDDNNGTAHTIANIASGTIAPGGVAVLYNADDLSLADFEQAWGSGINLIAVTNWAAMALGNSGDTVGIWASFGDYSGDHQVQVNVIDNVTYTDVLPWPADDGFASIYLADVTLSNDDGANWGLSAIGVAGAYSSLIAPGNNGLDIASPGVIPASDATAPAVTAVYVSGSGWSSAFIDAVDGGGTGSGNGLGVELSPDLKIPTQGVDTIVIQFSESVVGFDASNVALLGVGIADYLSLNPAPTVQYDPVTFRGTIVLSAPISADRVRLAVNDAVTDAAGNMLDGNGDSNAGGIYDILFDVLVGDANGDGSTDGGDIPVFALAFGSIFGDANYNPLADWNSDGSVDGGDLPGFAGNFGTALTPGVDPAEAVFGGGPGLLSESVDSFFKGLGFEEDEDSLAGSMLF